MCHTHVPHTHMPHTKERMRKKNTRPYSLISYRQLVVAGEGENRVTTVKLPMSL